MGDHYLQGFDVGISTGISASLNMLLYLLVMPPQGEDEQKESLLGKCKGYGSEDTIVND